MTATGLKNEIHISISYTGYYTLYVVYLNWTTLKRLLNIQTGLSPSLYVAVLIYVNFQK